MTTDYRAADRKTWETIFAAAPAEWLNAPPSDLMKRAAAHLESARRVLDLGSGFGRWSAYVASRTRARLVGVDYALGGNALARRAAAPRTSFVTGEITELPFHNAHFDGFLAVLILESVTFAHAEAAMRELSRVVATGSPGFLLFNPWPLPPGSDTGNPTASCSGDHLSDVQIERLLSDFDVERAFVGEHSFRAFEVAGPRTAP